MFPHGLVIDSDDDDDDDYEDSDDDGSNGVTVDNGRFGGLPTELMALILTDGACLAPEWRFCARAVCRLWRNVLDDITARDTAANDKDDDDDDDDGAYEFLYSHDGRLPLCCKNRARRPHRLGAHP